MAILNRKRLKQLRRRTEYDEDLTAAIESLNCEIVHLQDSIKVLKGHIAAEMISDECRDPTLVLDLVVKNWALKNKRPSVYMSVVEEVQKSHIYQHLCTDKNSGGGGGGSGAYSRGGGAGAYSRGGGGGGGGPRKNPLQHDHDKGGRKQNQQGGKGKGKKKGGKGGSSSEDA